MFMTAPKKAAKPVSSPRSRPIPTAISPNVMTYAHPGLGAVVDEHLDERAIPVIGDRRAAFLRDRRGPLPVGQERGAAIDPAAVGELVIAGLEPGEAEEQADRQPEQAGRRVAEQEPGERRSFDLDRLAARLVRSWNSITRRTMNEIQKPTVMAWLTVLPGSGSTHGLTRRTAARSRSRRRPLRGSGCRHGVPFPSRCHVRCA